jgi:PAS domain S-box-containing protein
MASTPTGRERTFPEDEIIVSKTDVQGRITYVNETFSRVSGYSEHDVLGAPHSVVRHPDMPRSVFKLAWDRIQMGHEIFAYVVNLAKNGDHYWVIAHITPTRDEGGRIVGFHSNRRVPDSGGRDIARGIYAELLTIERRERSKAAGMEAATTHLLAMLDKQRVTYDEFVFSTMNGG